MAFPLLPIISAVAPAIIGGAFSANAQKKQNKANQKQAVHEREIALQDDATRFQRVRDGAIAAGFNPLTALQYGGTTSGFGSGRVANQVFDWGPTASAALTAALPELSGQAGVARTRETLEQDLLKVQADALRASTTAAQQALTAASAFQPIGGTGAYTASSGGASSGAAGSTYASGRLATNREVTELTYRGNQFQTDPYTDDVDQSLEPRYGDIVSSVGGIGVLAADVSYNLRSVPMLAPSIREMFRIEPNGPVGTFLNGVRNWSNLDNITIHNEQSKSLTPESVQWPSNMMPTLGPVR